MSRDAPAYRGWRDSRPGGARRGSLVPAGGGGGGGGTPLTIRSWSSGGSTSVTTTHTTTLPAGWAEGDLLVLFAMAGAESGSVQNMITPSGWTVAVQNTDSQSRKGTFMIAWKVASAGQAAPVLDLSSGSAEYSYGMAAVYDTDGVDVSAMTVRSVTAPTVTATGAGTDFVFLGYESGYGDVLEDYPPSGFSTGAQREWAFSGIAVSHRTVTAGATGTTVLASGGAQAEIHAALRVVVLDAT